MSKKYTYEEVKEYVEKLGYEFISEEYINVFKKFIIKDKEGYYYLCNFNNIKNHKNPECFHTCNPYTLQNIKLWLELNKVELELVTNEYLGKNNNLILKDKIGYFYSICWANLQFGNKPGIFHITNPYTIQNIKLWCKLNNKLFELISSKYEGNHKKLKWKCLIEGCQEIFESTWGEIYSDRGCSYCVGKQIGLSNCLATKNPKLAKQWHPVKNGDLTPYDVSCGSYKNIWWQCSKNPKHEWQANISSRNNGNGCPYCSGRYATKEYNLLIINPKLCEEWDYNKNKKKPEEYCPNSGIKVWWKCKECDREWKATIASRNNGIGCPGCNESKGEKRIREYLKNNINYIPQKQFDGLIGLGSGNLLYDFYFLEYNLLIEYQGKQHERYIPGFHKDREAFEIQQEHDKRKREYAKNNNINLLEIWYWDFDNIENILENYLNN
jgi:hypothetical protein